MKPIQKAAILALVVPLFAIPGQANDTPGSEDWPGLWGSARDGVTATRPGLSETPSAGVVWKRQIGSGFSGISVSGGRGFTGESDGTFDNVVAFDLASGREAWRVPPGPTYRGHDGSKDGPIATPTLDEGRVFIISAKGALLALDASSGRVLWRHDLKADFGAAEPSYGFGASPLAAGSRLVAQVGGATHNLAAFDKATGRLLWAVNHSKATGYASPVLGTLGGRIQVVVHAGDTVYGAAPEERHAIGGGRSGVVISEGRLFALVTDGEVQQALALDATSGKVLWQVPVGPHVDASMAPVSAPAVEATPAGYREKAQIEALNRGAQTETPPSFAAGMISVRNDEEIVAIAVNPS